MAVILLASLVFVIVATGFVSLWVASFFAKFRKEKPLPPPPFEPYMVYIPRPFCGGCGVNFLTEDEHYCRRCGGQREYQEIEIAYKGNLKRLSQGIVSRSPALGRTMDLINANVKHGSVSQRGEVYT
jgi:hypothetical protein